MLHRLLASSVAVALASPALAGITFGGSVGQMMVGVGFIDADAADPFDSTDSALIDLPPVGSYLLIGGQVPGIGVLASHLVFGEQLTDRLVFQFESVASVAEFGGTPYEAASAGNRVTITVDTEFVVSLRGTLMGSGAGLGAFNVVGDSLAPVYFTPSGDPIAYDRVFGPGTYTFGFGSLVGPAGGASDFMGEVSFIAIPAPGTAALLVVAAGMVSRRRRR